MTDSPFSKSAIERAVEELNTREGNTLEVGVESEAGQRPSLTVEAQGDFDGSNVTWAAWAKTGFTKAKTAVGAKLGFRW